MLEFLFPTAHRVKSLEENLECKDKAIKSLQERLNDIDRTHRLNLENERNQYERELTVLRSEIQHKNTEGELVSSEIETAASLRIEREVGNADVHARTKVQKEIDTLNTELVAAKVQAAQAHSKDETIACLTGEVQSLHAFIEKLLKQLPIVDMTKFSVNVDVKPADVTLTGCNQITK